MSTIRAADVEVRVVASSAAAQADLDKFDAYLTDLKKRMATPVDFAVRAQIAAASKKALDDLVALRDDLNKSGIDIKVKVTAGTAQRQLSLLADKADVLRKPVNAAVSVKTDPAELAQLQALARALKAVDASAKSATRTVKINATGGPLTPAEMEAYAKAAAKVRTLPTPITRTINLKATTVGVDAASMAAADTFAAAAKRLGTLPRSTTRSLTLRAALAGIDTTSLDLSLRFAGALRSLEKTASVSRDIKLSLLMTGVTPAALKQAGALGLVAQRLSGFHGNPMTIAVTARLRGFGKNTVDQLTAVGKAAAGLSKYAGKPITISVNVDAAAVAVAEAALRGLAAQMDVIARGALALKTLKVGGGVLTPTASGGGGAGHGSAINYGARVPVGPGHVAAHTGGSGDLHYLTPGNVGIGGTAIAGYSFYQYDQFTKQLFQNLRGSSSLTDAQLNQLSQYTLTKLLPQGIGAGAEGSGNDLSAVAKGYMHLASRQNLPARALGPLLGISAKSAIASGGNVGQMADIIGTFYAENQKFFGKPKNEAGYEKVFTRIANMLHVGTKLSNLTEPAYAAALSKAMALPASQGVDPAVTAASVATLSSRGFAGSTSGTWIRDIFSHQLAPTKSAQSFAAIMDMFGGTNLSQFMGTLSKTQDPLGALTTYINKHFTGDVAKRMGATLAAQESGGPASKNPEEAIKGIYRVVSPARRGRFSHGQYQAGSPEKDALVISDTEIKALQAGNASTQTVLQLINALRGGTALSVLAGTAYNQYQGAYRQVKAAEGGKVAPQFDTSKTYADYLKSAPGQLLLIEGAMKAAEIQIGQDMLPIVQALSKSLVPALNKLSAWAKQNPQTAQLLAKVAAGLLLLKPVLGIFKDVGTIGKFLFNGFKGTMTVTAGVVYLNGPAGGAGAGAGAALGGKARTNRMGGAGDLLASLASTVLGGVALQSLLTEQNSPVLKMLNAKRTGAARQGHFYAPTDEGGGPVFIKDADKKGLAAYLQLWKQHQGEGILDTAKRNVGNAASIAGVGPGAAQGHQLGHSLSQGLQQGFDAKGTGIALMHQLVVTTRPKTKPHSGSRGKTAFDAIGATFANAGGVKDHVVAPLGATRDQLGGLWGGFTSIMDAATSHLPGAESTTATPARRQQTKEDGQALGTAFAQGLRLGVNATALGHQLMSELHLSMRAFTGTHSPSILMRVLGHDLGAGLLLGFNESVGGRSMLGNFMPTDIAHSPALGKLASNFSALSTTFNENALSGGFMNTKRASDAFGEGLIQLRDQVQYWIQVLIPNFIHKLEELARAMRLHPDVSGLALAKKSLDDVKHGVDTLKKSLDAIPPVTIKKIAVLPLTPGSNDNPENTLGNRTSRPLIIPILWGKLPILPKLPTPVLVVPILYRAINPPRPSSDPILKNIDPAPSAGGSGGPRSLSLTGGTTIHNTFNLAINSTTLAPVFAPVTVAVTSISATFKSQVTNLSSTLNTQITRVATSFSTTLTSLKTSFNSSISSAQTTFQTTLSGFNTTFTKNITTMMTSLKAVFKSWEKATFSVRYTGDTIGPQIIKQTFQGTVKLSATTTIPVKIVQSIRIPVTGISGGNTTINEPITIKQGGGGTNINFPTSFSIKGAVNIIMDPKVLLGASLKVHVTNFPAMPWNVDVVSMAQAVATAIAKASSSSSTPPESALDKWLRRLSEIATIVGLGVNLGNLGKAAGGLGALEALGIGFGGAGILALLGGIFGKGKNTPSGGTPPVSVPVTVDITTIILSIQQQIHNSKVRVDITGILSFASLGNVLGAILAGLSTVAAVAAGAATLGGGLIKKMFSNVGGAAAALGGMLGSLASHALTLAGAAALGAGILAFAFNGPAALIVGAAGVAGLLVGIKGLGALGTAAISLGHAIWDKVTNPIEMVGHFTGMLAGLASSGKWISAIKNFASDMASYIGKALKDVIIDAVNAVLDKIPGGSNFKLKHDPPPKPGSANTSLLSGSSPSTSFASNFSAQTAPQPAQLSYVQFPQVPTTSAASVSSGKDGTPAVIQIVMDGQMIAQSVLAQIVAGEYLRVGVV